MQAAIDRVTQTFMMMASLTREEVEAVRERRGRIWPAWRLMMTLAVEGLRYLRGHDRVSKRRIARTV
jgi:hypothetical protein